MRGALCRAGRTSLAAVVLDRGTPPIWMVPHVNRCLSCQALAANARRVRRDLAQMPPEAATLELAASSDTPTRRNLKLVGAALVIAAWATFRARAEGTDRRSPSFLSPAMAVYSPFRRTP